nr:protein SHQ1 homolog [Aedes albopictus]
MKSNMSADISYTIEYSNEFATLAVNVPDLDLEQEASFVLEVHESELVFTLPPHHARIPSEKALRLADVYPKQIDYEKGIIVYDIPLSKATVKNETPAESASHAYGFGSFYSGALNIVNNQDFKTLSNPEIYTPDQRRSFRLDDEIKDFNLEHYGMDHVQYLIDGFGLHSVEIPFEVCLSKDQQIRIRMIMDEKKRDVDKFQTLSKNVTVCFNLIDIILAVLYDKVVNSNELNEAISHVNIHRISCSLSYFEQFSSYEDVLVAFYRRSCMYPYYRSKDLSRKCVELLVGALSKANSIDWVLEKLLYCYDAFKSNDCAVLNHYYIKDCIRFIQLCKPDEMLQDAGCCCSKILPTIHNKSLGFGEEAMVRKLVKDIIGADEDSTDSDDTSGSSDDETSESESISSDSLPEENVLEKLMNLNIQA